MSSIEHLSPIWTGALHTWRRYLLDSLLGIVGPLPVTGLLAAGHLYPRIPNISIVYLLIILGLASTRGSYSAILASVVAYLSFDFFLVPPIFSLGMYHVGEWIALFIFLVTAILTGQMASALRKRAEQASRRERETRTLYDLVRLINREEEPERQLQAITQAIVDVFSPWGVRDCAILQPDSAGSFQVQASAYQPAEQIALSSDEKAVVSWVMAHGRPTMLYDDDSPAASAHAHFVRRIVIYSTAAGRALQRTLRLIPLKAGPSVVGVLRLRLQDDQHALQQKERLEEGRERPNGRTAFFWTFLDQATWLIERARLQRENLAIAVLQRTDHLRAALLSSVSHDLRTPLTAIKASASLLLQEHVAWDEETRRDFARSIVQEADRLNRLVSNLLDMSRIEEGALKPEKNWYSLATLIREVIGHLRPYLDGHAVRTHFPPDDLLLVELDYVQIGQVLTNLIENAIRYTPPQSPIDVSAHLEGGQVEISVADRGPGIAAEDVERVFDKFYRVLGGGRPVAYPSGSGLGLAICKGMVEAHGGRIWAEPREGGGLVVNVVLPVGERERIVL